MSLGNLFSDMKFSFMNEDESPNKKNLSHFQLQGEQYLKFNDVRVDEIEPQFKVMENFTGFNNNAVNQKNDKQLQELIDLDKEYQRKLSNYSKQKEVLMSETNSYLNKKSSSDNKLLGKNIRFSNGEMGYVTDEGIYKQYSSMEVYDNTAGKNNCPTGNVQLNINRSGEKIDTNPSLSLGTSMERGQSCGNAGQNVYVVGPSDPGSPTYVGCYKMSSDNGLNYQSDMGNTADVTSCKYRAYDVGSNVFAVANGGKGTSRCYIGENVDRAKNGGIANVSKSIWSTGGNWPNASIAGLNNAGQLIVTNKDFSENYFVSNPPKEGCDPKYGGGINLTKTVATWGANCTGSKYNLKIGNWTDYVTSLDMQGKPTGDFIVGGNAPSPFNVDPAYGCKKNFSTNYQCGNGIAKNIFIGGEAGGKAAIFDCRKEYDNCRTFKIVMQDDGNLVIYSNEGSAVWSSKTNGNVGEKDPSKSSTNGKNGRNYLLPGEYLNDGEFIGSTSGNCYAQMKNGIGLQVFISAPGCSLVGDEKYGMINSDDNKGLKFNVYEGYFNENVNFFSSAKNTANGITSVFNDLTSSTSGLKNQNTGTAYSIEWTGFFVPNLTGNWQFKTNSDDASFIWIGNNATSGYSTSNALIKNPGIHPAKFSNEATIYLDTNVHYPIRIQYGNGGGTDAFQFFLKPPNGSYTTNGNDLFFNNPPPINSLAVYTIPLAGGTDNIGKVGYVTADNKLKEYPSELIKKGNKYIELGNFTTHGNDIKTINAKTADECMTGCNETEGCDGFVFNPVGTCALKNSNMYPKTARIKSSSGEVLYKRSVNLKNNNSCSKNVVPISGSLWSNYVKDGNMTEDVLCNLGNYTKNQQDKLEVSRKELETTVNKMYEKINKLDESDKFLLNKYGLNKKKIEKDITMFNLTNKQNKQIDQELMTLQGMQYNSETELISENYKNIVWSILGIMLVIGSIKLLK